MNVCSEEAVSFFTDIIYRFDIPNTIISDNTTNSQGRNSSTFATTTTFAWTGQSWRTQIQIDKSKGKME
jgi:hypothetical protein